MEIFFMYYGIFKLFDLRMINFLFLFWNKFNVHWIDEDNGICNKFNGAITYSSTHTGIYFKSTSYKSNKLTFIRI